MGISPFELEGAPAPTRAEAAAIAAALALYRAEEGPAATERPSPLEADPWRYVDRLREGGDRFARLPKGLPADPWRAAARVRRR